MDRSPHHGQVQSHYQAAQIRPGGFHPHQAGQVTTTAGVNPDPPAERQASGEAAQSLPYLGESPTGYDPITIGAY